MSSLSNAAEWFKSRKTPIQRWFEDDVGRYAFRTQVDGQRFLVAAKNYLHDGQASFMAKLAERAIEQDALLMLFVGDKRWVFDPRQVIEHGHPSDPDESKRQSEGEDWLDVPADWGVTFDRWVDHGHQPTWDGPTDNDTPDRPWDVTQWGDDDAV